MHSNQRGCLYFISIGLRDERDISIKALEAARNCDLLFAEFYTTKLNTTKAKLENLIGKPIRILTREEVEEKYQEIILNEAKIKKVGLLVGGDVFTATTHVALKLEAIKQGVMTKIIHGSSIISAIAETGLHLQRFGASATVPFPEKTKGKSPESVYEVIRLNKKSGMHTLLLLDIADGKCMQAKEAMKVLLNIEKKRKEGIFTESTEAVVFARAGSDNPLIAYGRVSELMKKDFRKPPMVLILPGILHFTEKEYLDLFKR